MIYRSRRFSFAVLLSAAMASIVSLAGCGAKEDSAPIDAGLLQRDLQMRILGGAPPDVRAKAETEFSQAVELQIRKCMSESGFEYVPLPTTSDPANYGDLSSLDYAKAKGFGIAEAIIASIVAESSSNDQDHSDQNLTVDGSQTVEYGSRLEQCRQVAVGAVRDEAGIAGLIEKEDQIYEAISSDRGVVDAAIEWRGCAESVGYIALDRKTMIGEFAYRAIEMAEQASQNFQASMLQLESLKQEEISAAVATFPCSERFDSVWRARGEVIARAEAGTEWVQG